MDELMLPNALSFHRAGVRLRSLGLGPVARLVEAVGAHLHRSHLDPHAKLGDGLELGYGGVGVVIAPGVVIGPGCSVSQDVTIGERRPGGGVPRLGADIFVGTGAKILGPVTVGDGATIGANALVIDDVPPGAVVAGIPARVLERRVSHERPRSQFEQPAHRRGLEHGPTH